jgi:hypothetical protein
MDDEAFSARFLKIVLDICRYQGWWSLSYQAVKSNNLLVSNSILFIKGGPLTIDF